jgi:hypothetical protein
MAKLYANEKFPLPVVEELRRLGHDVLTTCEAGDAGQSIPDEHIVAFAKAKGRTIVTLNRKHFIRLHKTNPDHAGIIVCTVDIDFIGQANRINAAIESKAKLSSELIRVNRPSS